MIENENGKILIIFGIILLFIISIAGGFFYYKSGKEDINTVNENNNIAQNEDKTEDKVQQVSVEDWRKKLWDYFLEYDNYMSVRLESDSNENQINNDFLLKKGFDISMISNESNTNSVSKKTFDDCLLKYYGRLPKDYNNEIYEYDSKNEVIKLREGSGYDNHGTSVFFLTDISFDGIEYTAYFNTYTIDEVFDENFNNGSYTDLLTFKTDNDSTIVNFDYEKMYNNLVNDVNLYNDHRINDVKIVFQEKEEGVYQIHWLSSVKK